MLKPNFFIVGAPKAGTFSLYVYLKQHPQVYLPKKEINYLCPDLTMRTPPITESLYLSYYNAARNQKAVGDNSVFYLCSALSAQTIKHFNPAAKIIIMLRNPVQMVYSLHSQLYYNGDEPIEDFEKALNAESNRRAGKLIPPCFNCPLEFLYYSSVAKYYEQVLRYKSVFAEDKIHIIFFDDLKAGTELEYRKVLKFLELEEIIPDSFEIINSNKEPRNRTFLNFLLNPPGFIKASGRFFFPHHSRRREWVIDRLWHLNTKYTPRPLLKDELKQRLVDMYKDDIVKLGNLLNRDLSNWLKI